ncbi:MAG: glycosyltransferase [Thiovulaceae bacterium]|nr:glycosyltransferase [Sulfurimonadaceae bacterium]
MFHKTEEEIMKHWQTNNSLPVVSICTITYNHEKYISEAIDSFLMQETDFPFEIVIGEDYSLDTTINIIKKYMEKYPNIIKLITSENNVGMNPNFIRTLLACKGEYIAICEGDDYWTDSKKLQLQKDFLDKNKEYVITYSSVIGFNDQGLIKKYIGGVKKDLSSKELREATPINTLTVCFRNIIKSFPLEFSQAKYGDLFLWALLSDYGQGKYLDNISPSMYRIHRTGVHSMLSMSEVYDNSLISFSMMFAYYKRIDDKEMMKYYKKRILEMILNTTDSTFFIFTYSLKKYLIRKYAGVKKIFKSVIG